VEDRPWSSDQEAAAAEGFRGPQVCSLVASPIGSWTTGTHRAVAPSIADATGSGSQRRYSYSDVLELKSSSGCSTPASSCSRRARRWAACAANSVSIWLRPSCARRQSFDPCPVGRRARRPARGGQGVFNILPLSESSPSSMRRSWRSTRRMLVHAPAPPAALLASQRPPSIDRKFSWIQRGTSARWPASPTSRSDVRPDPRLLRCGVGVRAGRVRSGVDRDGRPTTAFRPTSGFPSQGLRRGDHTQPTPGDEEER